jgi:hypothetical protein
MFDFRTQFCLICGVARTQYVNGEVKCIDGDNVVAISHILCGRVLDKLCGRWY